jgi:type IV secretion system protein VirB1
VSILLAVFTLAQVLTACGINTGIHTMSAIVSVESGGNPNAIHDNTTGRSYFPQQSADAVALASGLVGAGHSVDLGLAQINSGNLPGLGLSVQSMFDPCINVRAGAQILSGDYSRAVQRFGPTEYAALRAIGAYNTGQLTAGDTYITKVLDAYDPGPVPPPVSPAVAAPTQTSVAPKAKSVRRKKMRAPVTPADAPLLVPLGGMQPR